MLVEGRPIQVYGDGSQVRDFNYIGDVVRAFLLVAASEQANGQVYNLGSPDPISLRELADLMTGIAGGSYSLVPWPKERKAIDIGSYYGDYGKIRAELGWEPLVPLKEGLKRTIEYYKANLERYL